MGCADDNDDADDAADEDDDDTDCLCGCRFCCCRMAFGAVVVSGVEVVFGVDVTARVDDDDDDDEYGRP